MKGITQIAPTTRLCNIKVDPQDCIGKVNKLHAIRENAVQTWYNHEVEAICRPIWEQIKAKAHYDEYKSIYDRALEQKLDAIAALREMEVASKDDPQQAYYYQGKIVNLRTEMVRLGVQFASFTDTVSQGIEAVAGPKILLAREEAVLMDLRLRMANAGIAINSQNRIRSNYHRYQTVADSLVLQSPVSAFDVNNEVTDPTL